MKKTISLLLTFCLIFSVFTVPVYAETGEPGEAAEQESEAAQETLQEPEGEGEDQIVTTKHTAVINGKELSYTANTGTMMVESMGKPYEIFYIAFTKDGEEDLSKRPVTFAFNGGPGSGAVYVNIGLLGPRRVETDEEGRCLSLPSKLVDNENSLLDLTDLVFIDPVGTGYSRAVNEEDAADAWSIQGDAAVVGDFIRQYVNRNKRWKSGKYLAGESYGTMRCVAVCDYLSSEYNMNLNGLLLISSANDYSALVYDVNNELPIANFIPTCAAIAWYHGALSREYQDRDLEDFLDEVKNFVADQYVSALYKGNRLTKEEEKEIAGKLSGYLGLSEEFILKKNLRIDYDTFSSELLKDQKLVVGRNDGRMTGPATEGNLGDGSADPSSHEADLAFGDAFCDYISDELGYQTDRPYKPLSLEVLNGWDFLEGAAFGFPCQEQLLGDCMSKNKFLKVWVTCGYYDGATAFYATEWTFSHITLNEDRKDNLQLTYYPSGHMFYIDQPSLESFRKTAEEWFQ